RPFARGLAARALVVVLLLLARAIDPPPETEKAPGADWPAPEAASPRRAESTPAAAPALAERRPVHYHGGTQPPTKAARRQRSLRTPPGDLGLFCWSNAGGKDVGAGDEAL